MNQGQEATADKHQGCTLTIFIIYTTEKWSQDNSTIRQHSRNKTSYIFTYSIFENHQLGSKLQEWEHTCIEHEAEHCDIPETCSLHQTSQIRELESLFRFRFNSSNRCIFLLIHHAINKINHDTSTKQGKT